MLVFAGKLQEGKCHKKRFWVSLEESCCQENSPAMLCCKETKSAGNC